MPGDRPSGWRSVHRALADPLRIRLLEALWFAPHSVKELAEAVGLPPDRLYYHLRQLEQAAVIEVSGYRPLPGGKVDARAVPAPGPPPGRTGRHGARRFMTLDGRRDDQLRPPGVTSEWSR